MRRGSAVTMLSLGKSAVLCNGCVLEFCLKSQLYSFSTIVYKSSSKSNTIMCLGNSAIFLKIL